MTFIGAIVACLMFFLGLWFFIYNSIILFLNVEESEPNDIEQKQTKLIEKVGILYFVNGDVVRIRFYSDSDYALEDLKHLVYSGHVYSSKTFYDVDKEKRFECVGTHIVRIEVEE